jgi:hypothetical protein
MLVGPVEFEPRTNGKRHRFGADDVVASIREARSGHEA